MSAQYLADPSVILHGSVDIARGCIIESGVVLGHPSAAEVASSFDRCAEYACTREYYDAISGGVRIGAEGIIRSGTVIYSGTTVGGYFDCGHNAVIRERVIIGENVYVKNYSEIMAGVRIGDGCRIAGVLADNCVLGDEVSCFGTLTHRYGSYLAPRRGGIGHAEAPVEAPTVGDRAIIGRGAVVIGGVRIGRRAIIGPNAVVTFDVDEGQRVTASTARVLDRRGQDQ